MAPRLSGQTSIFGVVFFVFEFLLGIERQKKLKKFTILTRKPRSYVRILIYRTWPIRGHESSAPVPTRCWLCLVINGNLTLFVFYMGINSMGAYKLSAIV